MSLASLEQTATVLNSKLFIASGVLPLNRTPYVDGGNLENGSVHAVISGGRLKLMFRLTGLVCSPRNSQNPFVHIDPNNLEVDFSNKENNEIDPHLRRKLIGNALVASIIEGFKPYIFKDINIAKTIEELSINFKKGLNLVFTTLRIPTEVPNQLKYKIGIFTKDKKSPKYSRLNTLTFSITRVPKKIIIEIDSDKAAESDTIAINTIVKRILWLLEEHKYTIEDDSRVFNSTGSWTFDDYRKD